MAASTINEVVASVWPNLAPAEVVVVLQSAADSGRTVTGWTQGMTLAAFAQYLGEVYTVQGTKGVVNTLQPFVTTVIKARGTAANPAGLTPSALSTGKVVALVALTGILGYFAGKGFGFSK